MNITLEDARQRLCKARASLSSPPAPDWPSEATYAWKFAQAALQEALSAFDADTPVEYAS